MRNLLIAGLAAMSLIAFGACGGDEEETSTKECTSNADCADGKICSADNKCVDDPGVTPGPVAECTTNADCTDASKPVCDNGTCVADSTVSEGCATNDDCTNPALPICDNGTCVADSATPSNCAADEYEIDGNCYAEGDACNSSIFVEACVDNTVVYCYDNVIEVIDCGADGYSCEVIQDGHIADCFDATTDACAAGDEDIKVCAYYGYYSADMSCEETVDGDYYYYYVDPTGMTWNECESSCDDVTGQCIEVPTEWTCEASYYGDGSCDCGCGVVDYDCADASYESCEYSGCAQGTHTDADNPTACTSVATEGDTCDTTYEESCVDGVILSCAIEEGATSGTIEAYDCGAAECLVDSEGDAACYSADTACQSTDDPSYNECYEVDYGFLGKFSYSMTMECSLITEGKYYYISTDYEDCSRGCEESTGLCVTIEVPAGWTSDPDYYGDDYCDCGGGIVDIDCADATYASCEYNVCAEGHPSPDAPTTCVSVDGEGDACTSSYETTCLGNVLLYCSSTTELVTGWDCGDLTCNPEAYDGCE